MTLEEHIEAEKRVASFYLEACQTTREADEFGVYGKEAQMYEDKYCAHTERAGFLEELKTLRKALMLACEELGGGYCCEDDFKHKCDNDCATHWEEYFMQKAREENDIT
ncbi:MAG: hypothetical protein MJ000_10845 [Bacteroidales bacterium]|nr:hypothetical protein [Bacteroidales bacterium]